MLIRRPGNKPRAKNTYRQYLRANAVEWQGVKPDRVIQHPPLILKISKRGEKHYVKLWE
jgi:hypothetical protein